MSQQETLTLTEFLLARFDEDEAADPKWGFLLNVEHHTRDCTVFALSDYGLGCNCDGPKRWLAEVEAKRRIVGRGPSECGAHEDQAQFGSHHYPDPEWSHCDGCSAAESADRDWLWTLATLAVPYADHPDYRQEWKP